MSIYNAICCGIALSVGIGSVLGKANNLQVLLASLIAVIPYSLNEQIVFNSLSTLEFGGSIRIWLYAGYYGLGLSLFLSQEENKNSQMYLTDVNSNHNTLMGSVFIFSLFPLFNSIRA